MLPILSLCLMAAPASSEWPQWMGPTRNNVWHDTGILDKFPPSGPKILWRAPVHGGYSGPAVAGGKLYVMDYISKDTSKNDGNFKKDPIKGTERVLCLNVADGKEVWKYEYEAEYRISYPAGPRCTPLVHDGKVYTLGAMGHLACLDAAKGDKIWSKELTKEYNCKAALWGYASHPVIDGKKLITLGGTNGCHVIALDKDSGKEIWKTGSDVEQGYSPVQFATIGGIRQMIVISPRALRGYDPETGKRYWSQDYDASSGSIIMTPVICGDHCYVGGFQAKNLLVKLGVADGKPTAEKVWRNERSLGTSPVNVQPFLQDNVLYSYSEDGTFHAIELPSGKRLWSSGGPVGKQPVANGTAFIVKNGDRFFFFAETGHLVIGKLSKEKYEEIDRAKLLEPTGKAFNQKRVWCMPAFADKKMYVRNDKELICVDLAK